MQHLYLYFQCFTLQYDYFYLTERSQYFFQLCLIFKSPTGNMEQSHYTGITVFIYRHNLSSRLPAVCLVLHMRENFVSSHFPTLNLRRHKLWIPKWRSLTCWLHEPMSSGYKRSTVLLVLKVVPVVHAELHALHAAPRNQRRTLQRAPTLMCLSDNNTTGSRPALLK